MYQHNYHRQKFKYLQQGGAQQPHIYLKHFIDQAIPIYESHETKEPKMIALIKLLKSEITVEQKIKELVDNYELYKQSPFLNLIRQVSPQTVYDATMIDKYNYSISNMLYEKKPANFGIKTTSASPKERTKENFPKMGLDYMPTDEYSDCRKVLINFLKNEKNWPHYVFYKSRRKTIQFIYPIPDSLEEQFDAVKSKEGCDVLINDLRSKPKEYFQDLVDKVDVEAVVNVFTHWKFNSMDTFPEIILNAQLKYSPKYREFWDNAAISSAERRLEINKRKMDEAKLQQIKISCHKKLTPMEIWEKNFNDESDEKITFPTNNSPISIYWLSNTNRIILEITTPLTVNKDTQNIKVLFKDFKNIFSGKGDTYRVDRMFFLLDNYEKKLTAYFYQYAYGAPMCQNCSYTEVMKASLSDIKTYYRDYSRDPENVFGFPARCQKCREAVCFICSEMWEHGEDGQRHCDTKDCTMYKNLKTGDDKSTMDFILETTKPCPYCGEIIYRQDGCNFVTCKCKKSFCWSCGGKLPFPDKGEGDNMSHFPDDPFNPCVVTREKM